MSMTKTRVLVASGLALLTGLTFGYLTLDSKRLTVRAAAREKETQPARAIPVPLDRGHGVLIAAELLPTHEPAVVVADSGASLLIQGHDSFEELGEAQSFRDGQLRVELNGRSQRVWLYAVVAPDEPRVTVANGRSQESGARSQKSGHG